MENFSPTIFGRIFESMLNPETKRSGGIHYTSPENIHKVIDPLFLDDLNREFETGNLEKLHDKIANLKFFDPACGSGNFLIETYISLRNLEDRIIEKIGGSIKISTENFYGIEINSDAVQIAKLFFKNIIEGNALMIDWKQFIPDADYIIGNPPFIGARVMSKDQKSDVQKVFNGWKNLGNLNYVACWFKKASLYIVNSRVEVGFVSTDSICQGESVGTLWKNLFADGIKINFANRSFKWDSDAQVFCVIIGFARFDRKIKLLDGIRVQNINGYLLDASNICIENRTESLCNVPKMTLGNMPNDNGNLIIEAEDLEKFLEIDPRAKKFIRKIIGAKEFIYNIPRYCLWLVDATPDELQSMKNVYERVAACKKYRLSSRRLTTRKLAATPWIFGEIRQPSNGNFIVIPEVSSSHREYIPIGFLNSDTIAKNQMRMIPNGSLALFGVLTSKVHMAWIRTVSGRRGIGYDYSINIVYNNFPFPKFDPRIEITAQKILDARDSNKSLAELYDPNSMPIDLRKAHNENDQAVLNAYNFPKNITESEIISRLFEMYQSLTN